MTEKNSKKTMKPNYSNSMWNKTSANKYIEMKTVHSVSTAHH